MRYFYKMLVLAVLLCVLTACAERPKGDPFAIFSEDPTCEQVIAVNGEIPEASAFLTAEARVLAMISGISVSYAAEIDQSALGEQTVRLVLTAADGRTREIAARASCIYDHTPPVLHGVTDRSALCGEGLVLRAGVSAEDNCYGACEITVDSSAVDTTREGVYPVVYTATDAVGNRAQKTVNVYIYSLAVTEDMLWEQVDALLLRLVTPGMTREQQCRSIYDCVQASMTYTADSDKSDWVRNAYTSLFVRGSGDCHSYFSAAKALLHRLGIPYREIQRQDGLTEDTHYFLMVNIAEDGERERWYYFDTTELRHDGYQHSGCLLTEAQILAYNAVRPHFYSYDHTGYPAVESRVITPTPELGITE